MASEETDAIATPLSANELRQRLSSHMYTLYMNYSFLIKGGVFTLAALTLFHLASEPATVSSWVLFIFWCATLGFSIVAISTWSRGSLLTNARANMGDVILPLGMAVPEYVMFIVLDPTFTSSSHLSWALPCPWSIWYLAFSAHALFAVGLTFNRIRQTKVKRDYSIELQTLADEYLKWIKKDCASAAVVSFSSLVLFLSTITETSQWSWNYLALPKGQWLHAVIALIACYIAFKIIKGAHLNYETIADFRPAKKPAC